MITDKEWSDAVAEIESLRFQLVNNIMPPAEREDIRKKLSGRLFRLGYRIKPMGEK